MGGLVRAQFVPLISFVLAVGLSAVGPALSVLGLRAPAAMTGDCQQNCKGAVDEELAEFKVTSHVKIFALGGKAPKDPTADAPKVEANAKASMKAIRDALNLVVNCQKVAPPGPLQLKPVPGSVAAGGVGGMAFMYGLGTAEFALFGDVQQRVSSVMDIQTYTVDGNPIKAGDPKRIISMTHSLTCTPGMECRNSTAYTLLYGVSDAGFDDVPAGQERQALKFLLGLRDKILEFLKTWFGDKLPDDVKDAIEERIKKLGDFSAKADCSAEFGSTLVLNGLKRNDNTASRIEYEVDKDLNVVKALVERGKGYVLPLNFENEDQDILIEMTTRGPASKAYGEGRRVNALAAGGSGWMFMTLQKCDPKLEFVYGFNHAILDFGDKSLNVDPRNNKKDRMHLSVLERAARDAEKKLKQYVESKEFQDSLSEGNLGELQEQMKELNGEIEKDLEPIKRPATSTAG